MKCIICDKCGKIIKDPKELRPITCWRPMAKDDKGDKGADFRQDIVWEKDLCVACAQEVEQSIVPPTETTTPTTPPAASE